MTLIDAPDPALDLDAIEVRYQDGAHVAGAARTSAAWADQAVADIGTLLGALVEARDDINEVIRERDQITEKMLADLDAARAELAALKDGGEWQWLYGFTNTTSGEFVHHGGEGQARAFAAIVKRPIQRRRAWYGPVEPVTEETDRD